MNIVVKEVNAIRKNTQLVECLPSMLEALGMSPGTLEAKPGRLDYSVRSYSAI